MGDIIYSRQNSDGTFQEKWLTPSASHFVICGPCGDLTTFTGSLGGGGDTVKVSVDDSTSDYLQPKIQAGPNVYISKSVDGSGYEVLHFSSSATVEFDDSHLVTTASFNAWTGSPDSQFAGTSSYTKISETSSYGLHFTASEHMVVHTTASDQVGYIDLYGGMVYGTASWAVSASWPQPFSFDDSHLVTTASFNDWTGSTDSQFSGTASFAISASYAPYDGTTCDFALQAGNTLFTSSYAIMGGDTVKVSTTDLTASYLESKIQAGPNIYISKSINEGFELLHISSSGGGGSGPTDAYVQGGNSFGATGVLGLLDNYDLTLVANNTTRMAVARNDIKLYTSGSFNYSDNNEPVVPTLRLYDALGEEYCQIRGRYYGPPDYYGSIGIGLHVFEYTDDSDVYSSIAIGNNALRDHRSGDVSENIVIGHDSVIHSDPSVFSAPSYNVVIGNESYKYAGATHFNNVLVGHAIFEQYVTSSTENIWENVMVGCAAGRRVRGAFVANCFIGEFAGYNLASGSNNVLLGAGAAQYPRFMQENVGVGVAVLDALDNNAYTGSWYNTAVGNWALGNLNDRYNTALGWNAASSLRSGQYNIAIGVESHDFNSFELGLPTGNHIISIGYRNFYRTTKGDNHIAIGSASFWHGPNGSGDIGIGYETFRNLQSGSNLIAFGNRSCDSLVNFDNSISNSIAFGFSSSLLRSGEVVFGGSSTGTGFGLVRPGTDAYTDLGSATHRWKDIYFSGVLNGNVPSASHAVQSDNSITSSTAITASRAVSAENAMGVIVHGATATEARITGYEVVTWIGSVEPDNAINNDIWIDTSP